MRSCVLVAAKVLRQISQPSHVDPAASQVASKSLPPELGLVLKLELVDRALKRNPLNTWSDGIDHQARKDSITRAAREALKVSERHWPANDPVRQQLSQLLAKLQ